MSNNKNQYESRCKYSVKGCNYCRKKHEYVHRSIVLFCHKAYQDLKDAGEKVTDKSKKPLHQRLREAGL